MPVKLTWTAGALENQPAFPGMIPNSLKSVVVLAVVPYPPSCPHHRLHLPTLHTPLLRFGATTDSVPPTPATAPQAAMGAAGAAAGVAAEVASVAASATFNVASPFRRQGQEDTTEVSE